MTMKKHRVIYNQDSTNLFGIVKEPITPEHVDRMVDEVADGGADVMLINTNAQRVNYPSRVWQTFWDGYAPGRREFFGPISDAELPGREAFVQQMKRLADQGCNYLTRSLARCRKKGITPGVTVRMNDMHDAPTPGTHLFSKFYMEHPDLWLNNSSACGWGAKGLNYERAAVRDYFLSLVKELAHDYDIDVMELDFLRFQCYFPRNDFKRHADIMTGFIRDVRAVLAASGRRIALTTRIAATPGCAYELGFDVAAWAREGLVDAISAGAFLNTQWSIPVDEFRALVDGKIAVYACTDYTVDRRPDLPVRALPLDSSMLRGFAAGHLAAGADGVELFNFFCSRETEWDPKTNDPSFATLRELGVLAPLRGLAKSYTLTCGWMVETDGAVQVPVSMDQRQTRSFQMLLAAEPDTVKVEASVVFTGDDAGHTDDLWLHMNNVPAGAARSVEMVPDSAKGARRAVFGIPARVLRDGRNTLSLRNEGKPLTVVSIDVTVHA